MKLWKRICQYYSSCMQRHRSFIIKNGIVFIGTFLLFLFNQFILKQWLPGGFVHGHLNDVLVMGVFLPYTNILLSVYDRKDVRLKGLPILLGFTLVVGVFWEFVAPLYTESTSDWYDVIAYLIGAVIYYLCIYKS